MKTYLAIALLSVPALAGAQSTPMPSGPGVSVPAVASPTPSDDSLETLLQASGTQKLVSDMQVKMKNGMLGAMGQTFAANAAISSDEQKAATEKFRQKVTDLLNEEFDWAKMKSIYMQVYRESFTQDQINDLITFYKSPTGKMFVEKMPIITQKTMQATQQQMLPLVAKIQGLMKESQMEVKAQAAAPSK